MDKLKCHCIFLIDKFSCSRHGGIDLEKTTLQIQSPNPKGERQKAKGKKNIDENKLNCELIEQNRLKNKINRFENDEKQTIIIFFD